MKKLLTILLIAFSFASVEDVTKAINDYEVLTQSLTQVIVKANIMKQELIKYIGEIEQEKKETEAKK